MGVESKALHESGDRGPAMRMRPANLSTLLALSLRQIAMTDLKEDSP
jgi:hypothetical protein